MAEQVRRTTPQAPKFSGSQATDAKTEEYDGQGNRLHAVRQGKVDAETVQNGMTTVPLTQADTAKAEDHTGKYIAVSGFEVGKQDAPEPLTDVVAPGDVVEGLSEDQLRPLIVSGAVRPQTKDEVRDK